MRRTELLSRFRLLLDRLLDAATERYYDALVSDERFARGEDDETRAAQARWLASVMRAVLLATFWDMTIPAATRPTRDT